MAKEQQGKKSETMSREIVPAVEKVFNLGIKILKDEGIAPAMAFYYSDHVKYCVGPLDFSDEATKTKTMNTLRLIARKIEADIKHETKNAHA